MPIKGHELLTPQWADYQLLDSGDREKLERFGPWTVRRPEPQAIWEKSLPEAEWNAAAATFTRERGSDEKGRWDLAPRMPQQWWVEYRYKKMAIKMRLGLTSFKHVGLFPEQAENWNFIYDAVREISAADPATQPRVLNMFAYTGGATLAAAAAGAQATHVDSVKQVVTWARENATESGLEARWITDDAMKFAQREERRANTYHGIILDPPAYGRGPDGEKWILEESLPELMRVCARLLVPGGFLILNLYSMGLSALLAKGLANQTFGAAEKEEFGELYLPDTAGKALPLGVFYRFRH